MIDSVFYSALLLYSIHALLIHALLLYFIHALLHLFLIHYSYQLEELWGELGSRDAIKNAVNWYHATMAWCCNSA
jgi:hypothetical protein